MHHIDLFPAVRARNSLHGNRRQLWAGGARNAQVGGSAVAPRGLGSVAVRINLVADLLGTASDIQGLHGPIELKG